jgi:hypothetical protein
MYIYVFICIGILLRDAEKAKDKLEVLMRRSETDLWQEDLDLLATGSQQL